MAYINGKEVLFSANVNVAAGSKRETFAEGATITVEDNTIYIAQEEINNLTIEYPTDNFICSLIFTIASAGEITVSLPESRYIGETPTFANGETWEISIHNGVVVGGRIE